MLTRCSVPTQHGFQLHKVMSYSCCRRRSIFVNQIFRQLSLINGVFNVNFASPPTSISKMTCDHQRPPLRPMLNHPYVCFHWQTVCFVYHIRQAINIWVPNINVRSLACLYKSNVAMMTGLNAHYQNSEKHCQNLSHPPAALMLCLAASWRTSLTAWHKTHCE